MKNQKRTIPFKLRVLELSLGKEQLIPKEAFAKACKEYGTTPSGCMTDYSKSYLWDYKVEIKKKSLIDEDIKKFLALHKIKL